MLFDVSQQSVQRVRENCWLFSDVKELNDYNFQALFDSAAFASRWDPIAIILVLGTTVLGGEKSVKNQPVKGPDQGSKWDPGITKQTQPLD